jgi:hypothetical protein
LTVVWAMATGAEAVSWLKVLCLIGIVGSVVGLRLVGDDGADTDRAEVSEPPRRAWRRSRSERLL